MSPRQAVERFHLVFLKHFTNTVSPGTICLKGGVNLRLYHGSPRLSEDMDFDARIVAVATLRKNVNKTLKARPLVAELAAAGIALSEPNDDKQTATCQRWKFDVIFEGRPTATRLEFSRRKEDGFDVNRVSPPAAAILGEHQLAPFLFPQYLPPAAYRQKINALATRRYAQARDVFDLQLLSRHAAAGREAPPALVEKALEQLATITFAMFLDLVIPFLPADLAAYYGTEEAWSQMKEQVRQDLTAALPPPPAT
ncbi:MAG: nucleotidyl transferase AbiEii/AbiGii toxin family protein [Opitutaceae bacterium]|nr:nucleotidyl transferase AbiEii/AbiGii toxin family protein [Opitutaceae bacterium]